MWASNTRRNPYSSSPPSTSLNTGFRYTGDGHYVYDGSYQYASGHAPPPAAIPAETPYEPSPSFTRIPVQSEIPSSSPFHRFAQPSYSPYTPPIPPAPAAKTPLLPPVVYTTSSTSPDPLQSLTTGSVYFNERAAVRHHQAQDHFTAQINAPGGFNPSSSSIYAAGSEANVYDFGDPYLYREDKRYEYSPVAYTTSNTTITPAKQLARLADGHNIGCHELRVSATDSEGNYRAGTLMRKMPGHSLERVYPARGDDPTAADAHNLELLQKVGDMPERAFDELVEDTDRIRRAGYVIDPNPANLLVDPKRQAFSIVDLKRNKRERPGMATGERASSHNHMMNMLTDPGYGISQDERRASRTTAPAEKESRRKILEKHAIALFNNSSQTGQKPPLLSEAEQEEAARLNRGANTYTTADTYQQAGLTGSHWRQVERTLEPQKTAPESRSKGKKLLESVFRKVK